MVRAGELREILKVQRPTRVSNGSGGFTTTYSDIIERTYAKVVEERSTPEMIGGQENINNYVHFRIRYRPVIAIKIADRLVWRGFNFIVNNIKVDPLRTYIDIYVNSEMETSIRGEVIIVYTFDETFDETFN